MTLQKSIEADNIMKQDDLKDEKVRKLNFCQETAKRNINAAVT